MAKVLTVSRTYPSYHNRKGEDTFFIEKIWSGLADTIKGFKIPDYCKDWDWYEYYNGYPKGHTVRAGKRWKAGDMVSLRYWGNDINPKSGRKGPYHSKQIIIAPDIEIKKVFDFRIEVENDYVAVFVDDWIFYEENDNFVTQAEAFETLAKNDGLTVADFKSWFKWGKPFDGQILVWSDSINY